MFESPQRLFHWLEQLAFAAAIRESTWLFPTLETVHVLALVIVIGSILSVDTRLLGLTSRGTAFTAMAREMLPWTWAGFALASVAGLLMFASKAATYAGNGPFQLKVVLLLLAGCNMAVFHRIGLRNVGEWDTRDPPLSARLAGALSLLLWLGVLTTGRWIGFTT